jgi:hypothetical protein
MRRLSIFLLLAVFAAGCATSTTPVRSSYNSMEDETKYSTRQIRLQDVDLQSGLSGPPPFYMQVQASCEGRDCTPSRYTLRFIKGGQKEIRLTSRQVSLTVGDKTMRWQERHNTPTNTQDAYSNPVRIRSGTVVSVVITGGQLSTLASVSDVRGELGGASFSLSYDSRAPIRELVGKLDQIAKSNPSAPSGKANESAGATTGR